MKFHSFEGCPKLSSKEHRLIDDKDSSVMLPSIASVLGVGPVGPCGTGSTGPSALPSTSRSPREACEELVAKHGRLRATGPL